MSPDTALVPQPTLDEFPEFVSIPVRIARNAAAWPDKQAVLCEDKARTWRDFDRRINRIARTLAGMGVGRGDKIAILAANSIEYLETFMGGLRAGACVVPLSTMAAADALEKMLDDCDAKVLFLSEQYRGLVEPYEERLGKLIDGGRIAYDFRRAGWRDFEEWLERASDAPFAVPL
ncbi:MAG TPA: class I adenylate-forming enzyme family protein, partial [Reyranella sp.]|nr:class I adenylate-forming enzyme family protein [Reyranella sp.]